MPAHCPICGAEHAACGLDVRALPPLSLEALMPDKNLWTADRRLYLDRAGKLVEADDPTRATLLAAGPGATIPYAQAEALGLTGGAVLGAAPDAAPAAPAERRPGPDDPDSAYAYLGGDAPPAEDEKSKAKPAPAENKLARKTTEDK